MSCNLGRTLYTNIWETANPLLIRGLQRSCLRFCPEVADISFSRSGFLSKSTARRVSSLPPRKTTHITRRFASGSFLMLGCSPSSALVENGATCAITPEKMMSHQPCHINRPVTHSLLRNLWKRDLHTTKDTGLRTNAPKDPSDPNTNIPHGRDKPDRSAHPQNARPEKPTQDSQHWGISNRQLFNRLPHVSQLHRPTKEELLAAANGFWSRLKIRFKWFSIRSVRPFNLDEITALFSWVLLGHVVWVVVGTTTFFSLLILAINTVFAQGMTQCLLRAVLGKLANFRRNFSWVDWQLPYKILRSESCFRVCDCTKMEGWCHNL